MLVVFPLGRPSVSLLGGALLLTAATVTTSCTSVLDIDGRYELATEGESGGRSSAGAGGRGGARGGASPVSGTGGTFVIEDSGVPSEPDVWVPAGGAGGRGDVDAGKDSGAVTPIPGCTTGHYVGQFEGNHAASVTVVGVPLQLSGTIDFRLAGTGTVLQITSGKLSARYAWGGFDATLTGTYDCKAHMLNGKIAGTVESTPWKNTFAGTLVGDPAGAPTTRIWGEQEKGFTAPPGTPPPLGTGIGNWSAEWESP